MICEYKCEFNFNNRVYHFTTPSQNILLLIHFAMGRGLEPPECYLYMFNVNIILYNIITLNIILLSQYYNYNDKRVFIDKYSYSRLLISPPPYLEYLVIL